MLTSDSSLPPGGLSDRKAWPNTTSDFDPRLRPRTHQTPAYSSSSTGAVGANWEQPTGNARSVRTRKRIEKVRQGTQVNRNTEDHTLYTCRTVPTGHGRRAPSILPGMSEPQQC